MSILLSMIAVSLAVLAIRFAIYVAGSFEATEGDAREVSKRRTVLT